MDGVRCGVQSAGCEVGSLDTRNSTRETRCKGFIAVTALLIMAILLMIGVAFLSMATTENTMVVNEINGQVAFNIAEAGIDHAKRVLLDPTNNNLNSILATGPNQGILSFGASVTFAGGTYAVRVTNNYPSLIGSTLYFIGNISLDPSGLATTDTDSRVVVESTGTYRTAVKVIRVLIEIPLGPPSPIYTMNGPGPGSPPPRDVTDFTFNGNSFLVQGRDTAPGQTSPIPGGAAVTGLGVMDCSTCDDTPLEEATDALNSQQLNNITGATPNPSIAVVTSPITASDLTTFESYLIANANVTYNDSTTIEGASTIGTQSSPQITVVNGDLDLQGTASGVGTLLVTGRFRMRGNATFQGIILVDGDGRVELEGSNQIWGSVMHINRSSSNGGETRLRIDGNAQVYYSRQAIQNAPGATALRQTIQNAVSATTLAWSERSPPS